MNLIDHKFWLVMLATVETDSGNGGKYALLGGGVLDNRSDRCMAWIRRRGGGSSGNGEDSVLHFPGHLSGDLDHGPGTARNTRLS